MDQCHLEAQTVLLRNFTDDVGAHLQMRLAACAAAGAHHHRNAIADRATQQQRQVALHRQARVQRLARSQVVRPGIGAAAVHADHVRLALQRRVQRGLRKAVAQDAAGGHHPHFFVLVHRALGHHAPFFFQSPALGRARPSVSRSVLPGYSLRNRPRCCSSGITRRTMSS
ncbi:hypothetical protein SDC9_159084 [bioreactor metagenome]|uniref:Uncharacterized protein n=1 Tax=bioreactor metagenome TaxID=1076179 RepID=A0A645FDV6_9ZZZZ